MRRRGPREIPYEEIDPDLQLATAKIAASDSENALRDARTGYHRLMVELNRKRLERERATERALLRALPEMVAAYRNVLVREMDVDSANDIAMAYQRELLAKTSVERILDAAGVAAEQKGVAGGEE